jgi:hypothetical protein
MIFQYTWQLILDNKKTATRRLINPGEELLDNPRRLEVNGRKKWQVGRSYAIQPGRRKKSVGRIEITDIKKEPLGQMTADDALAEGFSSLDEFQQTWIQMHGHYDPDLSVWVITFVKEATPEEKAKARRFAQEKLLKQFVHEQQEKLTAVGHELSEWHATEDLKMEARCTRCKGTVTVGVGEMNFIGYFPLMNAERCLADDPAQMEAAEKEVQAALGRVYALLLSKGRDK